MTAISMMRILTLLLALSGLYFSTLTPTTLFQQRNYDPPQPVLDFSCPNYPFPDNTPITLYAEVLLSKPFVDEESASRIKYRWQITGGRILEGQDTRKVVIVPVRSEMKARAVMMIRVETEGAPPEVAFGPTCEVTVELGCIAPRLFASYSDISGNGEERYLDRLADSLSSNGSQSVGYIVSYRGRKACIHEAEWRAARAKRYLLDNKNIGSDQIITIDGGVRENWSVDLFVQTNGTCGPIPTPTLARSESIVGGQCAPK